MPYAFFYQIPPMNSSANGDLEVGLIMLAIFLIHPVHAGDPKVSTASRGEIRSTG